MRWKVTRDFKRSLWAAFEQYPPLILGAVLSAAITLATSGRSILIDAVSYYGGLSLILLALIFIPRSGRFVDLLVQAFVAIGFGMQTLISVTTLLFRYDVFSYRKRIPPDMLHENVTYMSAIWLVLLPCSYLALIVLYEIGKRYLARRRGDKTRSEKLDQVLT